MRRLPVLIPVLLLVLAAGGARADDAPDARRPMLWVVEGETPVYLFGTIHIPDPRVLDLPDVVKKAFEASDAYYGEIDMSPGSLMGAQALMMLPPEQSLDALVGAEVWARLVPLMAEGGLPEMVLKRLKVWVAAMRLLAAAMAPEAGEGEDAEYASGGADEGASGDEDPASASGDEGASAPREPMDAVLYRNAAALGKTVGGLETIEEQVSVFDSLTAAEQKKLLLDLLAIVEARRADASEAEEGAEESAGRDDAGEEESEGEQRAEVFEELFEALIRLYVKGDADGMAGMIQTLVAQDSEALKGFMRRLFDERNVRMADRILEKREAAPGKILFIAVGAGHYAGKQGILALLAARGETVRRMALDEEVPERVPAAEGAR